MKLFKTLAATALVALGVAGPVAATPTLYLQSGATVILVMDGDANDSCPLADCVTFIGSVGVFSLTVTTGLTGANGAVKGIDLNTVSVSSAAGTLTLQYGDTDFSVGPGAQMVQLSSSIGGTTNGSVTSLTCINDNNVNPAGAGCQQTGNALGPFAPFAFSGSSSFVANVDGTFAIGQQVVITHNSATITSLDNELRIVPEPASLALVGLGLALLGFSRRKQDRA